MAFQMSYTDPKTQISTSASYWIPLSLSVDLLNMSASIVWGGWMDKSHFDAKGSPIFSHSYQVSGNDYFAFVVPVLMGGYAGGASSAFHNQAQNSADTIVNGTIQSFFHSATKL